MKKIIFKTLYEILFHSVIFAVLYCFFGWNVVKYLILIDIILNLILLVMRLYEFKLNKDIKKLEGDLFNGKRN